MCAIPSASFRGLAPNEEVRIRRRPEQLDLRSLRPGRGLVADDARAQRHSVGLADGEDGIAVVDDVVHRHLERVVGVAACAVRAQSQPFRADHQVDVAGWDGRLGLWGDAHRADARKLDHTGMRRVDPPGKKVAVADEFADEAVGRPVVDVERRADLLDLAVAEYRDPVRHRHRLGLIVGDVDHGDPDLAMNALELNLHLLAQILVERAQRLVEQEHVGVEHEAARQRHPLLLAAGQLARVAVGEPKQAHQLEHALGACLDVGSRKAPHLERKHHVLRRRHVREQRVVLEHHTDIALVGPAQGKVTAVELDRAAGRIFEAGDHQERCGLAGAAGAQEGDELATLDVDRDVVDGVALAVIGFDHFAQAKIRHGQPRAGARPTINASTMTQPCGSAMIGLRSTSSSVSAFCQAKSASA
jgi:hypothetical protein